jgi:type I restriction enzyme, S subunit
MLGEWRTSVVADLQRQKILLVEDGNHGEYRPRPDEFVDRGVAFIRAADMDSGRVLFDSASKINEKARQRITKGIGAPGDVLLSHKGTVGKVAIVPDDAPPFVCSPQTTFWRVMNSDVLDRKFLYAFLRSSAFHAQLASRAGETDMAPYVSLTSQRGLAVLLPPIDEQRTIAHILGKLDDKIELNRRLNETLESIARAIFKSWFVDFDPVRAKAEGGDTWLPNHIADLFPDSFVDSELGEIPKGWDVRGLDEIAIFLNGLALQKYPPKDGRSLPVIKIAQLRAGNKDGADTASIDLDPAYIVAAGDVLFSWSGSLECVLWAGSQGALNQHLFKVSSTDYPKWFYYLCIHEHLGNFRHIAAGKATTMGHIQRHHLSDAKVVIPNPAVFKAAGNMMEPIINRITHLRIESRTLATLRDTLLPKLLSGELRLKNAEKLLEKTI